MLAAIFLTEFSIENDNKLINIYINKYERSL